MVQSQWEQGIAVYRPGDDPEIPLINKVVKRESAKPALVSRRPAERLA